MKYDKVVSYPMIRHQWPASTQASFGMEMTADEPCDYYNE